MNTKSFFIRGSSLVILAGLVAAMAGCEDRVVVRHPAPVVRVVRPAPAVVVTQPVVTERVYVR